MRRREGYVSAQAYQEVSAQAQREGLILSNLSLVRHILGRLAARLPHAVDLENLEAAGVLGLVEAANRYEPERGIRFKTFAYTRIRGAIYDELRRNCPFPQELVEKITKIRGLMQTLSPPVSIETLARYSGLSEDDVTECLAAMRFSRNVSWEELLASNRRQPTSATEQPDLHLESAERKRLLVNAISHLPETERIVVTLYYMEELRLKEIGCVLNLSESRVSRVLKAAEHRLEEHIRAKEKASCYVEAG
jgi:RNA polymerase sigma factor for flagellar operon FliA